MADLPEAQKWQPYPEDVRISELMVCATLFTIIHLLPEEMLTIISTHCHLHLIANMLFTGNFQHSVILHSPLKVIGINLLKIQIPGLRWSG